ncbi:MAG TPA: tRNA (adenosine(37)-N6)-dimethylallyltransferase MiaA [Gemmatimonadaceae bacterium]|nr:tRNA (adenosine(37)-N6)-dimethylallyltransferase MiaA [Gemmatimonadaceae bacterium]
MAAPESLRIICGPTGAGKSALAMALAREHVATIISADSRQVYRGFDIGTAKPTLGEQREVQHRGIDVCEPTERYSAARWAEGARRWIDASVASSRTPLVVGGAGLYLRALTEPLFDEPPLDPAHRLALESVLESYSVPELRRWCEHLDPARAHLGRTQLLRAITVSLLSGTPISAWHARVPRAPGLAARYLVVDPGAGLSARLDDRLATMLEMGWEQEVEQLLRTVHPDAPAWNGTGYRWIRSAVTKECSRADALARVRIDTRQYAKRQRTWFRHQLSAARVTRIDPGAPDALERAMIWWTATDDGGVLA